MLFLLTTLVTSASISQKWAMNETTVPNSSVHYVSFQGVAISPKEVVVAGIGVKENFLLGYNIMTGTSLYQKIWDKSGKGYTNLAADIRTIQSGTFAIGFALLRKVNTADGTFGWIAELPLTGDCAAQDMKIDDIAADPADPTNYAYVGGSCQAQNQPQKIFVDKYDVKDGGFKQRVQEWDVSAFISPSSDCHSVTLTVNLEVDTSNTNRLYVGAKCRSTGLVVYDMDTKKVVFQTLFKENSYIKPKQYLIESDGYLYTLAESKVSQWKLAPKDTKAPVGTKPVWSVSVVQKSPAINDYTMSVAGNYVWVTSTENMQDNYLLVFNVKDGTVAAKKDFFDNVTPQGGLEIESITLNSNGTMAYLVTHDMRTGFPVGWTFKFSLS